MKTDKKKRKNSWGRRREGEKTDRGAQTDSHCPDIVYRDKQQRETETLTLTVLSRPGELPL